jgi:hypothetical protein
MQRTTFSSEILWFASRAAALGLMERTYDPRTAQGTVAPEPALKTPTEEAVVSNRLEAWQSGVLGFLKLVTAGLRASAAELWTRTGGPGAALALVASLRAIPHAIGAAPAVPVIAVGGASGFRVSMAAPQHGAAAGSGAAAVPAGRMQPAGEVALAHGLCTQALAAALATSVWAGPAELAGRSEAWKAAAAVAISLPPATVAAADASAPAAPDAAAERAAVMVLYWPDPAETCFLAPASTLLSCMSRIARACCIQLQENAAHGSKLAEGAAPPASAAGGLAAPFAGPLAERGPYNVAPMMAAPRPAPLRAGTTYAPSATSLSAAGTSRSGAAAAGGGANDGGLPRAGPGAATANAHRASAPAASAAAAAAGDGSGSSSGGQNGSASSGAAGAAADDGGGAASAPAVVESVGSKRPRRAVASLYAHVGPTDAPPSRGGAGYASSDQRHGSERRSSRAGAAVAHHAPHTASALARGVRGSSSSRSGSQHHAQHHQHHRGSSGSNWSKGDSGRRRGAPYSLHPSEHGHMTAAGLPAVSAAALRRVKGRSRAAAPKLAVALRRGKWPFEEEEFTNVIVEFFRAGLLPLQDGTTLRTYLSGQLHWCVPSSPASIPCFRARFVMCGVCACACGDAAHALGCGSRMFPRLPTRPTPRC